MFSIMEPIYENSPFIREVRFGLDLDLFLGRLRHCAFLIQQRWSFASTSHSCAEVVHDIHCFDYSGAKTKSSSVRDGCGKIMTSRRWQWFTQLTRTHQTFSVVGSGVRDRCCKMRRSAKILKISSDDVFLKGLYPSAG
jgi:hypothetical protein